MAQAERELPEGSEEEKARKVEELEELRLRTFQADVQWPDNEVWDTTNVIQNARKAWKAQGYLDVLRTLVEAKADEVGAWAWGGLGVCVCLRVCLRVCVRPFPAAGGGAARGGQQGGDRRLLLGARGGGHEEEPRPDPGGCRLRAAVLLC